MLNWEYITHYWSFYETALLLTVKLSVIGIINAILIGALCNVILLTGYRFLQIFVLSYIAFFRNTPLAIQLFFIFYALPKIGIAFTPEHTALIGLSLLGGSYMSETMQAGVDAVKQSQRETGIALGLSQWQLIRYLIFPQALSYSVPALGANAIFLIKETSIFSVIAVMELMNLTKSLIGMFYKVNESLLMLLTGYLIILLPLSLMLSWLEKRIRYAEFGN